MSGPRRVLVVDDESNVRDVARRHLELAGWDVLCVPGVEEACDALEAIEFSAVLCDMVLGPRYGWEVLAFALERGGPQVVMMSGDAGPEAIKDALLLGAKTVVAKPLTAEVLLKALA